MKPLESTVKREDSEHQKQNPDFNGYFKEKNYYLHHDVGNELNEADSDTYSSSRRGRLCTRRRARERSVFLGSTDTGKVFCIYKSRSS